MNEIHAGKSDVTLSAVDALEANENRAYSEALINFLFQLADDDLVLGHRDSEWLGVAPDIEGDVAFSSIAQDEVGHASLFYGMLEELGVGHADHLAFHRPVSDRQSSWLVERENGDWAYSLVRHYVYDVFEDVRLQAIQNSSYIPLQKAAAKVQREEYYHLLHGETMLRYLSQGGTVAAKRVQEGLNQVWGDLENLLSLGAYSAELTAFKIVTLTESDMRKAVMNRLRAALEGLSLSVPNLAVSDEKTVRGERHTEALTSLLEVMREVAESDAAAQW